MKVFIQNLQFACQPKLAAAVLVNGSTSTDQSELRTAINYEVD